MSHTLQTIVFLLGSISFIYLSREAFRNPQTHGFPRFFAFDAILGLVVLNAPAWFSNPLSLLQVISWLLLLDATLLAVHSFWILYLYGEIDVKIKEPSQVGFEKTTRLVRRGPYQLIRHPLYASLLLLTWGALLKQVTLVTFLLAVIASLALFLAAAYEERENLAKFGDDYANYMRQTKRFFPFVF